MGLEALVVLVVVGLAAGWLAEQIMKGSGFGLAGNIIVGIVGASIGMFVLGVLGISPSAGIVGSIVSALIGAVILLSAVALAKR
ncbi:transglycosylase associated protein [bacterium BMS3Bbin10]|nr:transglycosylase associated protein [bacterium BMS3Bbin10]